MLVELGFYPSDCVLPDFNPSRLISKRCIYEPHIILLSQINMSLAYLFSSMSDQNFYLSDKDKDIPSDLGVWEMTERLPIRKQRDRSSLK